MGLPVINDAEARMLSGEYNLRGAAAASIAWARHPDHQTRRVRRHSLPRRLPLHRPGYLLEDVFDPTGAGDSFAGGFIGYLPGAASIPKPPVDFADSDVP